MYSKILQNDVPETGLEPAPPCEDYNLNVARLPISPFGHHLV